MKSEVQFDYSQQAVLFLEDRIDEDARYAGSIGIFEDIVSRYPKIGDPILKAPVVTRRFPVVIPNLRDLAFYYVVKGRRIEVFHVEFADATPL